MDNDKKYRIRKLQEYLIRIKTGEIDASDMAVAADIKTFIGTPQCDVDLLKALSDWCSSTNNTTLFNNVLSLAAEWPPDVMLELD